MNTGGTPDGAHSDDELLGDGGRAPCPPLRTAVLWLSAVFVASRLVLYAYGVRMNVGSLDVFMQYLDPLLLRTRLLESVWYLHIQPPLFNLFLGVMLKVCGPYAALGFQVVYNAMGLGLALTVFALQVRMGVRRSLAFAVTVAFMLSPSYIAYEHVLMYTFPCALLLALAALSLETALRRPKGRAAWGYFAALVALGGIRSMFHLVHFIAAWCGAVGFARGRRLRMAAIGILPFLVLASFYAKNQWVFGRFTVCTFGGKNLWIKTVGNLGWDERTRLVEEGKLSEFALINRFEPVGFYPEEYRSAEPFTHIPALAEENKSTGHINYNHAGQIAISDVYGRDARYALLHYPAAYVATTVQAFFQTFKPAICVLGESTELQRLRPVRRCYQLVLLEGWLSLRFPDGSRWGRLVGGRWFLVYLVGIPGLFVFGCWFAFTQYRSKTPAGQVRGAVAAFICGNIFYIIAVGVLMELLETPRFRFMTDPLTIVLLGMALQTAGTRAAAGLRGAR